MQAQPHTTQAVSTVIGLTDFISEFGDVLIDSLNRSNPPVYAGRTLPHSRCTSVHYGQS